MFRRAQHVVCAMLKGATSRCAASDPCLNPITSSGNHCWHAARARACLASPPLATAVMIDSTAFDVVGHHVAMDVWSRVDDASSVNRAFSLRCRNLSARLSSARRYELGLLAQRRTFFYFHVLSWMAILSVIAVCGLAKRYFSATRLPDARGWRLALPKRSGPWVLSLPLVTQGGGVGTGRLGLTSALLMERSFSAPARAQQQRPGSEKLAAATASFRRSHVAVQA